MICLTGDIHHSSLRTGNQQHCDITEIQVARRYLDRLAEAGVKVTFFVSGLCFVEEWEDLQPICEHPLVEIGGHTYRCFEPALVYRVSKKLLGSYNGPAWLQRLDARKTLEIVRRKTGQTIRNWRNHMYMHGPHTEKVLAACGIRACSDGVRRAGNGPEWHPAGLYNFPLNVMADHEHLFHAERTPEWVAAQQKRRPWSDDYGPDSYLVDEWTDRVLEELHQHEAQRILSNMLIHPITLYLCDRLKSFERILAFLAAHETVHMSEVIARADAARRRVEGPS
jgi:peptidoglycan/xylan/chitin deacetylase (PgdA/CDA1 family)